MTDSGTPPVIPPRKKLSFEQEQPRGAALQQGTLFLYGVIAIALGGVAFYMAVIDHRPLLSGYVIAPAIGAAWFALRLFMMLNSRK